jgi:predicted O-methyltransferase YrrM
MTIGSNSNEETRASALSMLDSLDKHMASFHISEGYTAQDRNQTRFFIDLVNSFSPKRIMEIGFNSGHSSVSLLTASAPNSEVVSFDLGEHYYVDHAKAFVDTHFPGRHTLIKGNSVETVEKYANDNRARCGDKNAFDLIFIDGGHFSDIPLRDCINCMRLAGDDCYYRRYCNNEPTPITTMEPFSKLCLDAFMRDGLHVAN